MLERPQWVPTSRPPLPRSTFVRFFRTGKWENRSNYFPIRSCYNYVCLIFIFLLLMLCFTIHHSIAVKLEHGIILMYSALGLMNVNWHVSSPLAISFYPRLHASKCKSLYVYIDMYLYVYIQTHMVYAANQSFCMLASFFLWFFMGARRLPPTRTYLYKLRQRKKCNSFEWFRLHYANTSTVGGEYLFAHYKYIEFLAF